MLVVEFLFMTRRQKNTAGRSLKRHNPMRSLLFFPVAILLLTFGVLGGILWWNTSSFPADSQAKEEKKFLIIRGEAAGSIAKKLKQSGLIKSDLAFRLYLRFTNQEKSIQPGTYELSPSKNLKEIVSILTSGPKEIWVTYPEGLRREEVAARTIKALAMDDQQARVFWQEFMQTTEEMEGFLFPETYLFAKDVTGIKVANKLKETFDLKVTEQMIEDGKAQGLSLIQILTIASIVERETLTEEERPIVAGILLKRLESGWPLQTDATLQYITGIRRCGRSLTNPILDCSWWSVPAVEDKKLVSAYNTYTNTGLPPAPIANPSLSSVKAVIYPQDSPYWYYLHDSKGGIHYGRTIEEHGENIRNHIL